MSIKISVEPQALDNSAAKIEEQCVAYERTYRNLYQCVDEMRAGWQGKDNLAYTAQIRGFEQDFVQMVRLMRNYAQFLRSSSQAYRSTQEDRAAKARTLTN
ncbi:WXG100 family type VII secretion target [bacterium c-19]|nr:WXG100 family type VII secretion target [bacterium c-19]